MKGQPPTGTCVYCGATGPITTDHVPPRCLFVNKKTPGIVRVPSCFPCNNGASMDDEYFRMMLAFRADIGDRPDVQQLRHAANRSLQKARKVALRRAVLRNIQTVSLWTPAGVYAGQAHAYDVELDRLDRVAARVIRGLYYHHQGSAIPPTYDVDVFSEDGINPTPTTLRLLREGLLVPLQAMPSHSIGGGVFRYKFAVSATDPFASGWLLTYFDRVSFVGFSLPTEHAD